MDTRASTQLQLRSSAIERTPDSPVHELRLALAALESNFANEQTTRIRELAYSLYVERGRVDGHDVEDWLEAEAIIVAGEQKAA